MTDFLKQILDDPQLKGDRYKNLESLTQIKLYNRLLECYLVKKQRYEAIIEKEKSLLASQNKDISTNTAMLARIDEIQKSINELIREKKKINKHYMLFLFKIYDSEDGI